MKNNTKKTFITLALFGALIGGTSAYAQNDSGELQRMAVEMRQKHSEIKAQVDSGQITKEQAQSQWKALLEELKIEKEKHFADRLLKIQEKYSLLEEKNPEKALELKTRMSELKSRHEEASAKRQEIRDQFKAGEISREDAREMKMNINSENRKAREDARGGLKKPLKQ